MNVLKAIARRSLVRAFSHRPITERVVRDLFLQAGGAPSGGNLLAVARLRAHRAGAARFARCGEKKGPDKVLGYAVCPADLWEPYRSRRFRNGEQLYASISIDRDYKQARLAQLAKNAKSFGAPVGVFAFVERKMGSPQWADLGVCLQSVMVLSFERGLRICPRNTGR